MSSGGTLTSYLWEGLSISQTYRFSVRAVSQVGTSAAGRSPTVRPVTDKPSVAITSPAGGATVSGPSQVTFTVARNQTTNSPISDASLIIDDNVYVAFDDSSPWGPLTWETTWFPNGTHKVRVTVTDEAGKVGTATRMVEIAN